VAGTSPGRCGRTGTASSAGSARPPGLNRNKPKPIAKNGICSCRDKLRGAPGWETGLLVLS
jgi:hypothetical protein